MACAAVPGNSVSNEDRLQKRTDHRNRPRNRFARIWSVETADYARDIHAELGQKRLHAATMMKREVDFHPVTLRAASARGHGFGGYPAVTSARISRTSAPSRFHLPVRRLRHQSR
jgi:predicted lipase